jgi:predicted phage gp36 major capsid-like protein
MPFLAVFRVVPVWAWALAALLAWGAFQKHRATSATKAAAVAEQQAAIEAATAEAERQARAQEQAFADNARKASDEYTRKVNAARAAAADARTALDGLRDTIAAAPTCSAGQSAAPASGPNGAGNIYAELLGSCATTLQGLAAEADRLEGKLTGLQDYIKATQ